MVEAQTDHLTSARSARSGSGMSPWSEVRTPRSPKACESPPSAASETRYASTVILPLPAPFGSVDHDILIVVLWPERTRTQMLRSQISRRRRPLSRSARTLSLPESGEEEEHRALTLSERRQNAFHEPHGFREAGERVVGLFLVFECRDPFELDVHERVHEARDVDDSPAERCPLSSRVRRGHVLDMQIEQTVSVTPDRAQQVSSDANGVADVDAQADPVIERFDSVVDALGRRKVPIARAVVVDRDTDVMFLDVLVEAGRTSGIGAAVIVCIPAALAYSNACTISRSFFMEMTPPA